MTISRFSTPQGVRSVIANSDPVLRNLQITQSYHELSVALHQLFGGGPDVPWCCFAVWASKQAGSFIRNEEVPAPLRRLLGLEIRRQNGHDHGSNGHGSNGHGSNGHGSNGHGSWISNLLRSHHFLSYTRMSVTDVSKHVAEGNRVVYTKLGPIFADFLAFARHHAHPDPRGLSAFIDHLARDLTTGTMLCRAFRHYYAAIFETDPDAKAELVFLANALVGWHEQIRLQVAIDAALSAPVRRALKDPGRRFTKAPLPRFVRWGGAVVFERLWRPAILSFEDEWKRVATECMMSLGYPGGGNLRLGDDLPSLADGSAFPRALREISHPEAPELLGALDRSPNTLRDSAAEDWSRLGDRMNFIVDYFRSRQQESQLLEAPYSEPQVEAIYEGRIPEGTL